MQFIPRFFLVLFFGSLIGCTTTVGNRANLDEVVFTLGETHKNDVARTLGFPIGMQKDTEKQVELWAYPAKPNLTGLMYAVPTGMTEVTTHTWSYTYARDKAFENAAVIYAFDNDGVLIDVKDQRKQEQ